MKEYLELIEGCLDQYDIENTLNKIQSRMCQQISDKAFDWDFFNQTILAQLFQRFLMGNKVMTELTDSIRDLFVSILKTDGVCQLNLYHNIYHFLEKTQSKAQRKKIDREKIQFVYELFEQLIFQRFDVFIIRISGLPLPDLQYQFIDQLFRINTLFLNALETCHLQLKSEVYFKKVLQAVGILHRASAVSPQIIQHILDKVLIFNQVDLLANMVISSLKSDTKSSLVDCIKVHLPRLVQGHKLLGYLIYYLCLEANKKVISIPALQCALSEITSQVAEEDLLISFEDHILYTITMPLKAHIYLAEFIKTRFSYARVKQMFMRALETWANQEFAKFTEIKQQQFITNLLREFILLMKMDDLKTVEVDQQLQQGIQFRFNFFSNQKNIRRCGMVIWKVYVHRLKDILKDDLKQDEEIENFDDYPDEVVLTDDEQVAESSVEGGNLKTQEAAQDSTSQQSIRKVEESLHEPLSLKESTEAVEREEGSSDSDESDSSESLIEMNLKIEDDDPNIYKEPKHLMDCLLGLQSESKVRFESSLKHLNYIIRKHVQDLSFYSEELTQTLLNLHSADVWLVEFDKYRRRALVSLCIFRPDQTAKIIIGKFQSEDCSLGDRHFIVSILKDASIELSSNPQRYKEEQFNEYGDREQENQFYFQKLETKYYSKEERQREYKLQLENERKIKLDQKSRRWGETRIKHEESKIESTDVSKSLKPLSMKNLLVVKITKLDVYINRFNALAQEFYFPLLIPARTRPFLIKLFKKEMLLLTQVVQLMTLYLENGQNSHLFYQMVEEALDFLLFFKEQKDISYTRAQLQCMMKLSLLVKKDIVIKYPLVIEKLIELSKFLAHRKLQDEQDKGNKLIMEQIIQNISYLFDMSLEAANILSQTQATGQSALRLL